MEEVVSSVNVWQGRRVFLTGHTGFKGSWLALWLHQLGAEVTGYSLAPPTHPSLFKLARIDQLLTHIEGDVRDYDHLHRAVRDARPEVILHLAAQPLVRLSYEQPIETYATNVLGTAHLLEAARAVGGVDAFVCITTDKCYENREWVWPYRESDPLGGHDPYSSSKACAEIVVAAYRHSFFPADRLTKGGMAIASVRAGNVIGGGDWAFDRLIPDLVRAFEAGESPVIRSPNAVRPWQHVLEALNGYLMIAENLLADRAEFAEAWNFGPPESDTQPVSWIVERLRAAWGHANPPKPFTGQTPHEATLLKLDTSKARSILGWRPALNLSDAVEWIVDWHKRLGAGEDARAITMEQIEAYRARVRGA